MAKAKKIWSGLRNIRAWSKYMRKSVVGSDERRIERHKRREVGRRLRDQEGQVTPRDKKRADDFLKAVNRIKATDKRDERTRLEKDVIAKVFIDTILKDVNAKEVLSAKEYSKVSKALRKFIKANMEKDQKKSSAAKAEFKAACTNPILRNMINAEYENLAGILHDVTDI